MDLAKVEAIRKWPVPKSIQEVRGFIGFANFYRRFIQGFSDVARPLHDLTKKGVVFQWGLKQQQAFEELRDRFISAPILTLWNPDRPTRIDVDASGFATGGVIMQKLEEELWHPIAFRSASMDEHQRNYEIHD